MNNDSPVFIGRESVSITNVSSVCRKHFSILTAHRKGLYYLFGNKMDEVLFKSGPYTNSCLEVEQTAGSTDNISRLLEENSIYHFALTQSDAAFAHVQQSREVSPREEDGELKVVLGLYQEYVHLVCRKDLGISTFSDIFKQDRQIKVNLSTTVSGMQVTFDFLKDTYKAEDGMIKEVYYNPDVEPAEISGGKIDCSFIIMGYGGEVVENLLINIEEGTVPIPFDLNDMRMLDEKIADEGKSFYRTDEEIDVSYKAGDETINTTIKTLSVKVLLVTREGMDEDFICYVVGSLSKWLLDKENFDIADPDLLDPILYYKPKFEDLSSTETGVGFFDEAQSCITN